MNYLINVINETSIYSLPYFNIWDLYVIYYRLINKIDKTLFDYEIKKRLDNPYFISLYRSDFNTIKLNIFDNYPTNIRGVINLLSFYEGSIPKCLNTSFYSKSYVDLYTELISNYKLITLLNISRSKIFSYLPFNRPCIICNSLTQTKSHCTIMCTKCEFNIKYNLLKKELDLVKCKYRSDSKVIARYLCGYPIKKFETAKLVAENVAYMRWLHEKNEYLIAVNVAVNNLYENEGCYYNGIYTDAAIIVQTIYFKIVCSLF